MINKKIAFITEMGFSGKVPRDHPNARTEISWQIALQSDHFPIKDYKNVKGYDYVICILPKGAPTVDCQGVKISTVYSRPKLSDFLSSEFSLILKSNNGSLCYMQEGPSWFSENYDVGDQILHYNFINECDLIFCHNRHDKQYFKGINNNVYIMPTLLIEDLIKNIIPQKADRVMIGGNFSRWYGGFKSYLVASKLNVPMFVPSSHSKRDGEENMPNLNHTPYVQWVDWMNILSTFKFAVHLMPTIAAGTFSLNCAYFKIPCVGNKFVDTQHTCFPLLSVGPDDLQNANRVVMNLLDEDRCLGIGKLARDRYEENFSEQVYLEKMKKIFL
jgi:hypothetical protein